MVVVKSKHAATTVEVGCIDKPHMLQSIVDLYDCFNLEDFMSELESPACLTKMCSLIYESFNKPTPAFIDVTLVDRDECIELPQNDKDVVLGFSAGLDSVYQAILLKEHGYNVHLMFAKGINTYENGQAWKYAQPIADKLDVELIPVNVKKCMSSDLAKNPFKQKWPENPIKNELIMAAMFDICIEKGWQYISLGDDFDLSLKDAVAGVNTTDAKEVTLAFLNGVKQHVNGFKFIPIPKGHDKGVRLQKLIDYGLENLYYSCVTAGCRNKYFKKLVETKYGVKLFENNCGSCRKCCMHSLILHYTKKKTISDAYVDHCWKKLYSTGKSADYEFFRPDLPLETRIANLFSY